jgi:hypothetical protein
MSYIRQIFDFNNFKDLCITFLNVKQKADMRKTNAAAQHINFHEMPNQFRHAKFDRSTIRQRSPPALNQL